MTPQAPGTGTLAEQFADLSRQVAELSRSGPASPSCRAVLGSNQSIAATDVVAGTGWAATDDRLGWFTAGNPCYITVSLTGYYLFCFHANATGPTSGIFAGKIMLNSTSVVTSIATAVNVYASAGEGPVIDVIRPRWKLNAGDRLYWSTYTQSAATLSASNLGVATDMTVQFVSSR